MHQSKSGQRPALEVQDDQEHRERIVGGGAGANRWRDWQLGNGKLPKRDDWQLKRLRPEKCAGFAVVRSRREEAGKQLTVDVDAHVGCAER